ncbi:MAG: isocitrate/isopropylmalate dehydrogenase family protein, partial [Clostridia bacterium]|nr:isocitrate/isopropylmalate dehydrogenase family protein [Clostridia bacterium]
MTQQQKQAALEKFAALLDKQDARVQKMKEQGDFVDYSNLDKLIIGVCGGDGIGPIITNEAARVLEHMLQDEVNAGKVEFRVIDGLTIERRVEVMKAIPDDVPEELKQ